MPKQYYVGLLALGLLISVSGASLVRLGQYQGRKDVVQQSRHVLTVTDIRMTNSAFSFVLVLDNAQRIHCMGQGVGVDPAIVDLKATVRCEGF